MGWDTFKAQLWLLASQPGCGPVGVARLPEGRLHRGGALPEHAPQAGQWAACMGVGSEKEEGRMEQEK